MNLENEGKESNKFSLNFISQNLTTLIVKHEHPLGFRTKLDHPYENGRGSLRQDKFRLVMFSAWNEPTEVFSALVRFGGVRNRLLAHVFAQLGGPGTTSPNLKTLRTQSITIWSGRRLLNTGILTLWFMCSDRNLSLGQWIMWIV